MLNRSVMLFCFFFLLASLGILILKIYVQNLAIDIKNIEARRSELNNEIQVLKAEWSYLNNAERISKLAKKYLGLNRTKIEQIKYINGSNQKKTEIMSKNSEYTKQINTNWRYKSRTGILKISNN